MTRKLNIGEKLALILIGLSLLVTIFLTASYYLQFESALKERVFLQLSSVKQLKKVKILTELEDHLNTFNQLSLDNSTKPHDDFLITVSNGFLPGSLMGYDLPVNIEFDDSVKVVDLTNQRPEAGITVAFIANKKDGNYLISIVRFPDVQNILLERTGLGETGESYLVNSNRQLISKSRFDSINWKNIEVQTRGVIQAFEGNPGTDVFMDYRNIRVLGAFEKIEFNGLEWVLLSEINFDEALEPLRKLRVNLLFIFIIIFAFILIVSYYLSRLIVKPIISMELDLIKLSKGILEHHSHRVDREDEIGQMFNALHNLIEALKKTVIFAGEIGSGNFNAEYSLLSEKDKLGKALLTMKSQLQDYKANEFKLLRQNQWSILQGQEKERSRLSKELHDGVGPLLTTLRMQIQTAKLNKKIKETLLAEMDTTIAEIRRISNNLMPSVLEDFGVGEAINNLVAQVADSAKIQVKYKNDSSVASSMSENVQITLYRITQEAISNAIKHSNCSEIKISLSEFEEYVGLFISDNGVGFDTSQHFMGNGIRNMKERVNLLEGHIGIESDKSGTKIEIEIPLK